MRKMLKVAIILISILIVFIMCIIYKLIKVDDNQLNNSENFEIFEVEDPPLYSKTFTEVSNREDYFAVKNIIKLYFLYISHINGDVNANMNLDYNQDMASNQIREQGINAILDMYDNTYKSEFDITGDKIIQNVSKFTVDGTFSNSNIEYFINIEEIYVAEISVTKLIFLTKVNVNNINQEMLVMLDMDDRTFSICGEDFIKKYNYSKDMTENNINIDESDIQANEYNTFSYNSISDESMAREYFNLIKNNILNNREKMYSILQEEYKNKRFTSYNEFEEYVQQLSERINNSILYKYKGSLKDYDTIEYRLLDDYNNCYIIEVNANNLLDYKVQLDDYTIETEEFIKEYTTANDKQKVQTNVDKFIKMLNARDYKSAYNLLDQTFKENNFATVEDFEAYVKTNFFEYILISNVVDISKSGEYYVCKINISSGISTAADKKEKSFVISLEDDGTDFTMSFNIN